MPSQLAVFSSGNGTRALMSIGLVAAVALSPGVIASDELVALSDFFAIKRVSGGIGPYKWEGNEIYLHPPSKEPQYLGLRRHANIIFHSTSICDLMDG